MLRLRAFQLVGKTLNYYDLNGQSNKLSTSNRTFDCNSLKVNTLFYSDQTLTSNRMLFSRSIC